MTHKVRAGSKVLRGIMRRLPPGYHLESTGTSKHVLYGPDGVVRLPDGRPLTLPNSPSAGGAEADIIAKLRAAGISLAEKGRR
jgi:hypothetical protein